MSKGENKGKGKGNGVDDDKGRSVYVVTVNATDKTATVVRTPVGEEGSDGKVMLLVPAHIVKLLTEAAAPGAPELYRVPVAQNIREKLKNAQEWPEFEKKVIDINVDNMEAKKPGKGKGEGKPVDEVEPEVEDDTGEEPPVFTTQAQPEWQA